MKSWKNRGGGDEGYSNRIGYIDSSSIIWIGDPILSSTIKNNSALPDKGSEHFCYVCFFIKGG